MIKTVLHRYPALPSTMDVARHLALEGAPEGTIVQSDEQTAGRGRFGNAWTSPPGNLYMTTILRPRVALRDVAQLSFVVALALADSVDNDAVTLKWPNDVLAEGKKIAGMLLELESGTDGHPDFILLGTGINIAAAPEGAACALGVSSPDEMRERFIENLSHWYDRWIDQGFGDIRTAWLARAHGLNQPITVRMADRKIQGVFEGIDEAGNLLLRQNDGQARPINSGAVHFGHVPG